MSNFLDLTTSNALYKYGILANGVLTSNPTSGSIVVNNGDWYGSTVTGALTQGVSSNGYNGTDSSVALSEMSLLVSYIGMITSGLTNVDIGAGGNDITFSPGINYTSSGLTFVGKTITFDAGNDSNGQFFITDSGAGITFTDCTFVLANSARACNIFWLANGETTGAFTATNSSVPGVITTLNDFTTTSDGASNTSFTGHIYSFGAVTITRSGAGTLTVDTTSCGYDPVICYAKGTLILTKRGFVPIENIKAGYRVVTKGKIHENKFIENGAKLQLEPVMWLSKFKVFNLNSKSRPICIKKDAFRKNCPFKDLYVSPNHSLLLDGKMVAAKNIINGTTIYQDQECDNIEYYHLECENHSAVFANGVLAESYLEGNNRHVFENSIRLRRKVDFNRQRKVNFKKLLIL